MMNTRNWACLTLLLWLAGCLSTSGGGDGSGAAFDGEQPRPSSQGSAGGGGVITFSGSSSAGTSNPSTGGGGGSLTTGLPRDARLSQLDLSQQIQLCEAVIEWQFGQFGEGGIAEALCVGEGISAGLVITDTGEISVDLEVCEAAVAQCVAEGRAVDPDVGDCDGNSIDDSLLSCEATIADYEACAGAVSAQQNLFDALPTCESFDPATMDLQPPETDVDIFSIPQCAELAALCPDLAGNM